MLEHLGERRHRVPGEEPATGGDHRLGDRLRPLHEHAAAIQSDSRSATTGSSYFQTWNTKSGQICAHARHAVQPRQQLRVAVALRR